MTITSKNENEMQPLVNIFGEIKNNPMTAVGAKYTEEDVMNVWAQLSKQIIEILRDGKGIVVKGLGTFTLSTWSLETGNNNRTYDVWQPIFLISKSLTEDFDLHQPKQYVNDAVPLAPVCYYQLANICQMSKEAVVGCIVEATQCFRKVISDRRNVVFDMTPLGSITIVNTKVAFTFYDSCERRPKDNPKYCAKFPTANAPYMKMCEVPCPGHAKTKF